jgi:hypothetical protein
MTCYVVGRITIHDRERYGRYAWRTARIAAFGPVLRKPH